MKLMFKGYQGVFSDKSFCKLRRRRKCENEQSAVTLPCLPVSFQHITCAQVGNKYELTSALIGQKSDLKLPPNSGEDVSVFYFQLGNNSAMPPVSNSSTSRNVLFPYLNLCPTWVQVKLKVLTIGPVPKSGTSQRAGTVPLANLARSYFYSRRVVGKLYGNFRPTWS